MWYVIWTSTGSEKKVLEQIRNKVERSFIPYTIASKKIKGEWKSVLKPLFPGYLFADTEDIEGLATYLYKTDGFSTVLKSDKMYCSLSGSEAELIENRYLEGGIFDVSKGYIQGDKITITSGPLKDMEGFIRKINRHKRTALIELELFGHPVSTLVGLEIVEKT